MVTDSLAEGATGQYISRLLLGKSSIRSFRNLVVIPIRHSEHMETIRTRYVSADTVLNSGSLTIQETSVVASLDIKSSSQSPVLLLAGTYLRGGGQDRVVPASIVVPAHAAGEIPVRCVEQGRWNPQLGESFRSREGSSLVASRACFGSSTISQHEVWSIVEDISRSARIITRTECHGDCLDQLQGSVADYLLAVTKDQLPSRTVGMLCFVGLGHRMVHCAMDIFATPEIFQTYFERLCESVATTAVASRPSDGSFDYSPGAPLDGLWNVVFHNFRHARFIEERIPLNAGTLTVKPPGKSGCRVSLLSFEQQVAHIMLRWDAQCA